MIKKISLLTALVFLLTSLSGLALAQTENMANLDDYMKQANERFKDQADLNDNDFKTYFKVIAEASDNTNSAKILTEAKIDSLRFEYIAAKIPAVIYLAEPTLTKEVLKQILAQVPDVLKPNKDELELGKKYSDEYKKNLTM